MATVIQKIEALHDRLERARLLLEDNKIHAVFGVAEHYIVESSTSDIYYLVNSNCSCIDARQRQELTKGLCKHKLAVLLYEDAQNRNSNEQKSETS